MPTQKFFVRGLRHEDEAKVVEMVKPLRGVFFAAANHQDQCLEVDFEDDLVTSDEIRAAIVRAGYEAEPAG